MKTDWCESDARAQQGGSLEDKEIILKWEKFSVSSAQWVKLMRANDCLLICNTTTPIIVATACFTVHDITPVDSLTPICSNGQELELMDGSQKATFALPPN